MKSVSPNETLSDIEVKRTRSGRVVIPRLAGWTGERIVSSLDDETPLQYVSPTLDTKAQYLLSSSMLERLKKQKLIQEPFQVEEQNSSVRISGHLGKSSPQQKQKSLRTGCRKSVAHRTKTFGLSKSESKLICVELPETPQKKRVKISFHHQISDKLGHSEVHHETLKNHQLVEHNNSDSSGYPKRKGCLEKDLIARKQCTSSTNHSRNQEKENNKHHRQPVHTNIHSAETPDMVNKVVLTDDNHNLIVPPNVKNPGKVVRRLSSYEHTPHCSNYEADDENSCEAGKSTCHKDFANCVVDSTNQEIPASWEQQSESVSPYDKISEHLDCSQTTNVEKCNPSRRQEMYRGNITTDKHDICCLNVRAVEKNNDCPSDDMYEVTNKTVHHIQKNPQTVTDVSSEKTETNPARSGERNKMKVKKGGCHSELRSDDTRACEDSSSKMRCRKKFSDVQRDDDDDDMLQKQVANMSIRARNDERGRCKGITELDQQLNLPSGDSCSLHCSGLSKGHMRERHKGKHATDERRDAIHPGLKSMHSLKGERTFYYTLEHSICDDTFAVNEVRKNIKERTAVSSAKSVIQNSSPQTFGENDMLGETETGYSPEISDSFLKASKHFQSCGFKSNNLSPVKAKSVSEPCRQYSRAVHNNLFQPSEQVVMCKKDKGSDSVKILVPVLSDCNKNKYNNLKWHNSCTSSVVHSGDEFDLSGEDLSKTKGSSCVVNEIPSKNLYRPLNSVHTNEESDHSESSDQSMSGVAKESSHHADGHQNSHHSSQGNSSHKSSVKSPAHVTLNPKKSKKDFSKTALKVTGSHEIFLDEEPCQSDCREQDCRLPIAGFVNKSVSSEENVVKRQNHRQKSHLPKKPLFNPLRNQLVVSDVVSTSFGNTFRNKQTFSPDRQYSKKRSSPSTDENLFKSEQLPTKNQDHTTRNSKRHKQELFGRQDVPFSSHSVEAHVSSKSAGPLAADSYSDSSQSSREAVKGSACNSAAYDSTDSNQHVNNTFTEELEDFGNQDCRNQISNRNSVRHHQLVHSDSHHVGNSGKKKLKKSSTVCTIAHFPDCVLETDLLDYSSQRSDIRYQHRQKSENSRKDCDSNSLSSKTKSVASYAFNFGSSYSEKKRDISKNISSRCCSVESDFRNYVSTSMPIMMEVSSRHLEPSDLGFCCKMKSQKCKDLKQNSVAESDLETNNEVCTGFVDAFCHNELYDGNSGKHASETFPTNMPMFCSSDPPCMNQQQNLNEKNKKLKNVGGQKSGPLLDKKKVSDPHALMRRQLSETDKNASSDFQTALSPISYTSSAVKERCAPKQYMCMKGEGSVVLPCRNTSAEQTNSNKSLRTPAFQKQKTKKISSSQSVPIDSFNSADLESTSNDASVSSSCFSDDGDCTLNEKKAFSNCSPDGNPQVNSLDQTYTQSCGENRQDVASQDDRAETLKKKKAIHRLHTRFSEDDKFDSKRCNDNEDVLQFEKNDVVEGESDECTRTSSPSFEFSPVYDRKVLHSKKHSSSNKNIRRDKIDTYLEQRKTDKTKEDQEQTRPKKGLEQEYICMDSRTVQRNDKRRNGKANKDNPFIITELQKDENDDFRISVEDVASYCLADEDSDTVYINY